MKCSICGKEIKVRGTWTRGNDARPVNNGRCCDKCNSEIVAPRRREKWGIKINDVLIKLEEYKNGVKK